MSSRFDDNSGRRSDDDGIFHDINDDHGGSLNDDSGFRISDDSFSGNRKAFKFDISDGQVTAVYELKDGALKSKSLDDNGRKTYTVDGNDVIRTELKPFGTEITRYSDENNDGIYFRVSEQWEISSSSSSNGIFPKITDTISFNYTDGDDLIAVRSGEHSHGGHGADDFIFREAGHLHIDDFSSQQGDLLVFDTGLGLRSKEHLASHVSHMHHDGDNYIINFGSDVSITLVGVQPGEISWDDVSVFS